MERHFILPATIAAALHAGLLFGIRSHTDDLPPTIGKIIQRWPTEPLPPELTPPPEAHDEEPAATKGTAGDPPPMQPERPEPSRPTDFTFDPPQSERTVNIDVKSAIPGPRGDPFGDDVGDKAGPGVLRIIDLDGAPRARLQATPNYPFEAKSRGLSGEVLVEFLVDESGAVFELRVLRSSDRMFEEAALRAVARWKFEPGRRDGRIVRFKMSVPIVFRLDEN